MIPVIESSPDYRAEAAQQPPPPRPSRWPGVVVALLLIGIVAAMVVLQMRFADPPLQSVQPVSFQVHLAETSAGPMLIEEKIFGDPVLTTLYMHPEPLITHEDLISATVIEMYGQPAIEFTTNPTGAAALRQATTDHIGSLLAIVIDGQVRVAPRINSQIGAKGVIMGDFSEVEAERIAAGIMQH